MNRKRTQKPKKTQVEDSDDEEGTQPKRSKKASRVQDKVILQFQNFPRKQFCAILNELRTLEPLNCSI